MLLIWMFYLLQVKAAAPEWNVSLLWRRGWKRDGGRRADWEEMEKSVIAEREMAATRNEIGNDRRELEEQGEERWPATARGARCSARSSNELLYMEAVDFLSEGLGASVGLRWGETITRISGVKMEPALDSMYPKLIHKQTPKLVHREPRKHTHTVLWHSLKELAEPR